MFYKPKILHFNYELFVIASTCFSLHLVNGLVYWQLLIEIVPAGGMERSKNLCETCPFILKLFAAYMYILHKLKFIFEQAFVGLKSLLRDGLSEPEFYGDLVYKKKLTGRNDFSFQFRKIITRYRRIGCNKCYATVCMLSF